MKGEIVKIDISKLYSYDDITDWCEEHFGPAAMPYEDVKPDTKWAVHGGPRYTSLYQFLYEDDAMLFKLTWK